ncbi:MAG: aspartyl protease family protein [Aggregatilineales bacterium]
MPSLSGRFEIAVGPLINVGVAPAGNFIVSGSPTFQNTAFPTLLDTGASTTCISSNVAQSVGIQPIGMRSLISATQSIPVNVYLVDLLLPFGNAGFILSNVQVVEFVSHGSSPFQVLLGRDIICRSVLTMSFDGHFTFSL